jgi:hypothetical protein
VESSSSAAAAALIVLNWEAWALRAGIGVAGDGDFVRLGAEHSCAGAVGLCFLHRASSSCFLQKEMQIIAH